MSFLEYAPAPESRAILSLRDRYGLFIGGEFVDGRGTPFQTISPSSEERIAEIANANQADVDDAVAAARRAYDRTWSRMSGRDGIGDIRLVRVGDLGDALLGRGRDGLEGRAAAVDELAVDEEAVAVAEVEDRPRFGGGCVFEEAHEEVLSSQSIVT